jgi:hypothetical protein
MQSVSCVLFCRSKATVLVQDCLSPELHARLCALLRKQPFSICVDESTDVSVDSDLAVVVKVIDPERKKVSSTARSSQQPTLRVLFTGHTSKLQHAWHAYENKVHPSTQHCSYSATSCFFCVCSW